MVHRHERLCSASQLWLPHPALCIVLPECFRGLCVWSGAMGSKSGKLWNIADHDTDMPNSDLSQNLAPQWWSLLYADLTEDMILVLGKLSQAEWRHYGISFPELRTREDHSNNLNVNRNG